MTTKATPTIRPIGDRVLLRRHEDAEQISDGVIIPDRAKETPQNATVIAIGMGRKTDKGILLPSGLAIGDTVIFGQYDGDEVRLGDVAYTIIREDDILGILTDSDGAAI